MTGSVTSDSSRLTHSSGGKSCRFKVKGTPRPRLRIQRQSCTAVLRSAPLHSGHLCPGLQLRGKKKITSAALAHQSVQPAKERERERERRREGDTHTLFERTSASSKCVIAFAIHTSVALEMSQSIITIIIITRQGAEERLDPPFLIPKQLDPSFMNKGHVSARKLPTMQSFSPLLGPMSAFY